MLVKIDLSQREHNWIGKISAKTLALTAGTSTYSLSSVFPEAFAETEVYGLAFRRQSTQSLGGSPTLTKKVHTGGEQFATLCNLDAFVTGQISLKDSSGNAMVELPIEYAGFDNIQHEAGKYMQLILADGFDREQSLIYIDGSKVTTGEVLEILLLPILNNNCMVKKTC